MSMWDVDKNTDKRTMPMPNTSDSMLIGARMSHGTFGITLVDESSDISARVVLKDGHVEVYRADNTLMARVGVRPSDTEGAVEVANTSSSL